MQIVHGLDNGYSYTKDSQRKIFKSAFTYHDTVLSDASKITIDGTDYFFGMGNTTVDIDKIDHQINKICTLADLSMKGSYEYFLVVCLPIIQYKEKKDKFRSMVMNYNGSEVIYKGQQINIKITDVSVCPQGIAPLYSMADNNEDRILLDIGSYTINVALIEFENGKPKITKYDTWYNGILSLYANVINEINRRFELTLEQRYAEKVLKNNLLNIEGEDQDISFLNPIINDYLEPILTQFKQRYPYKNVSTVMCGGGAELLKTRFENVIKNSALIPDAQFANAIGCYNYGLQKYDKYIKMQNLYCGR